MIRYSCASKEGRHLVVISSEEGDWLDTQECPTKFEAMGLRDQAAKLGVLKFDQIGKPLYEVIAQYAAAPATCASDQGAAQADADPKEVT